jgi:NADH:ubiquinone oxidoreductase subunit 3 (subunit A)
LGKTLILQIIEVTMKVATNSYRFLPTSMIFLVIDILSLILFGIKARFHDEIWNMAIPLVVFSLVIWYLLKIKPNSQVLETI